MDVMAVAQSNTQIMQVEPELIQVLTVEQFIEKCLQFNEAHPEAVLDIPTGTDCPIHIYAAEIGSKACKQAVAGIKTCPVCGRAMCPVCGSHSVEQISRVTGYIQAVGGWNEAKKQELKDRQRYHVGAGGRASNALR